MTNANASSALLLRDNEAVYHSKLCFDLFLAEIAWRTLHDGFQRSPPGDIGDLYIPRKGSSPLLITKKNAERQQAHMDTRIPDGAYGPPLSGDQLPGSSVEADQESIQVPCS